MSELRFRIRLLKEAMMGLGGGSSPSWTGYYGISPGLGQDEPVNQPATGFPFRTQAAIKVWQMIQQIAKQNPKMQVSELIKAGLDKAAVNLIELSPEDSRLMELATNWLLSGKVASQAQIQPTPGNREAPQIDAEGHVLAKQGFP